MSNNPLQEAAALADRILGVMDTVDDHKKIIEALEESNRRDRERLSLLMEQAGVTELAGANARVKLGTKSVPQVRDWDELRAFIAANNAWELLHKRLGAKAWQERVDAGLIVPGVEQTIIPDMKITGRK